MSLLRPEVLASLSTLELVARSAVEGFFQGLHRSPRFGFSQEFAEYKAYSEGDDPRFIDWNVFARTERTYIKRFLGETNTRLMIALDVSASMGYGIGQVTKLRYAKFLAASLAYMALQQHDPTGLIAFDSKVRSYRPPSSRTGSTAGHPASARRAAGRQRHRSGRLVPPAARALPAARPGGGDLRSVLRSRGADARGAAAGLGRPRHHDLPDPGPLRTRAALGRVGAARGHGIRPAARGVARLPARPPTASASQAHLARIKDVAARHRRRPHAAGHRRAAGSRRCAST